MADIPALDSESLLREARAAYLLGDLRKAQDELGHAETRLGALPEPERSLARAGVHQLRGEIFRVEGDVERAMAEFEAMLACAPTPGRLLDARAAIGGVLSQRGEYDRAAALLYEVEQQAVGLGYQPAVASANAGLGIIAWRRGETDQALKYLGRAWTLYRALGDVEEQQRTLIVLGHAHSRRGEHDSAIRYHEEALRLGQQLGQKLRAAVQLNNLGECHQRLGDMALAYDYHQRSLALRAEHGLPISSDLIRNLGVDLLGLDRHAEALSHLRRALEMAHRVDYKDYVLQAEASLADGLLACGQPQEATQVAQGLLDEATALQAPYFRARALLVLGRVQLALGERERAYELLEEGHCAAKATHSTDLLWQLHTGMGEAATAPALADVHDRIAAELVLELAALIKDQELRRQFLDAPRQRRVLARAEAKGIKLIPRRMTRL